MPGCWRPDQQLQDFYTHLNEAVITTNDFAEGSCFRKREKVNQFAYCGLNPVYPASPCCIPRGHAAQLQGTARCPSGGPRRPRTLAVSHVNKMVNATAGVAAGTRAQCAAVHQAMLTFLQGIATQAIAGAQDSKDAYYRVKGALRPFGAPTLGFRRSMTKLAPNSRMPYMLFNWAQHDTRTSRLSYEERGMFDAA